MLAAQTDLKHAQQVKEALIKKNALHPGYLLVKEFNFVYFPISRKINIPKAKIVNTQFSFPKKEKQPTVKELLKGKLTPRQLALLPTSQEIIGTIMVIEIPEELRAKEKAIAEAFLQANKSIKTVVRKDEIHHGDYRLRKVQVLAGKNTKETMHTESGIKLKLHLEKTYYTPRLANERLRIARLVKKGEQVLVMFSGAAPYPLILAKHSPARKIYGVELNPLSHQYALENIALNNQQHRIILQEGDVRKILSKIQETFDRIVMPLPKSSELFLDVALQKARPGTIIHLYTFLQEYEIKQEEAKIKEICTRSGHTVRIVRAVKCGQYAPYVFRVCFDLKVS